MSKGNEYLERIHSRSISQDARMTATHEHERTASLKKGPSHFLELLKCIRPMRYKIQHVPLVMLVTFVPTILGILKISELKNSIHDCTSDVICVLTVEKYFL